MLKKVVGWFKQLSKAASDSDALPAYPVVPNRRLLLSDPEILSAIDPWPLACAVGVGSGHPHWSRSSLTFEMWLRCCEDTWISKKARELGVSKDRIKGALRDFRAQHAGQDYLEVKKQIEAERGIQSEGFVLGPGESVRVKVEL